MTRPDVAIAVSFVAGNGEGAWKCVGTKGCWNDGTCITGCAKPAPARGGNAAIDACKNKLLRKLLAVALLNAPPVALKLPPRGIGSAVYDCVSSSTSAYMDSTNNQPHVNMRFPLVGTVITEHYLYEVTEHQRDVLHGQAAHRPVVDAQQHPA